VGIGPLLSAAVNMCKTVSKCGVRRFAQAHHARMKRPALVLLLGLISFAANAVENYPDVPAMPGDTDWSFVHRTEYGVLADSKFR
jgi:hypothetical protein